MSVRFLRISALAFAMSLFAGNVCAEPDTQNAAPGAQPALPTSQTPGMPSSTLPPPPPPPPQLPPPPPRPGMPIQPADEGVDKSGMVTPPIDATPPGGDNNYPGGLNGPGSGAEEAFTSDLNPEGKPYNPLPGDMMPPPPPSGGMGPNSSNQTKMQTQARKTAASKPNSQ